MSDNVKGYTKYLVATDSIASAERKEYGAYEFGSETFGNIIGSRLLQDGSITNAKIGTITFNKIQGGTAVLGGTANGDGVLVVNNAAGSSVVTLNNEGITVNDESGTTIIDGGGIVSSNNFRIVGTSGYPIWDVPGSVDPQQIPGMSLAVPALSRDLQLFVSFTAIVSTDTASHSGTFLADEVFYLHKNGVFDTGIFVFDQAGRNVPITGVGTNTDGAFNTLRHIITFQVPYTFPAADSPGTLGIFVQGYTSPIVNVYYSSFNYLALGN